MHQPASPSHGKPRLCFAWALWFFVVGCAGSAADGSTPSASAAPAQFGQPNQLIVRFKPAFAALAQLECSAAYVALAGAQKGHLVAVKSVLFSGAQVIELLPHGALGVPSGAALSFAGYLGQQVAVDYAELDGKQQATTGAALPAAAPASRSDAATAEQARLVVNAQIAFRKACGTGLAEPQPAR